jgi:hypothetical protein
VGLPPRLQEDFANEVLGQRPVFDSSKHEAEDANVVPNEQHLHRDFVTYGDPPDQLRIRRGFLT